MSSRKPVVVYAASGYTGRLVCEALTRLRVPFVAAGRSQARLELVANEMRARGADCEARSAEHSPPALRDLFRGAEVVINVSGPFSLLGHAVVDAALVEGCHYLDSTGEQDFMLDVRRQYGDRFEKAKRLLSPSAAFLWAPGTAATERCLEAYPELDSFDVVVRAAVPADGRVPPVDDPDGPAPGLRHPRPPAPGRAGRTGAADARSRARGSVERFESAPARRRPSSVTPACAAARPGSPATTWLASHRRSACGGTSRGSCRATRSTSGATRWWSS